MPTPHKYDVLGWLARAEQAALAQTDLSPYIRETWPKYRTLPHLIMADGTTLSVQNSPFHYCHCAPVPIDYQTTFEVWCWPGSEETWWQGNVEYLHDSDPASYVPLSTITRYVMRHGGIVMAEPLPF